MAQLARPPEGCQGPGPTCQRPAGRSPAGEGVGNLVALITRRQPNWETRNPDVPRGQDRGCPAAGPSSDRGTQPGMGSWRLQQATLPRVPCALGQGSRAHTPAHTRPASSAQTCSSERFGTAGPQAAGGGWGKGWGKLPSRGKHPDAPGKVKVSILGLRCKRLALILPSSPCRWAVCGRSPPPPAAQRPVTSTKLKEQRCGFPGTPGAISP